MEPPSIGVQNSTYTGLSIKSMFDLIGHNSIEIGKHKNPNGKTEYKARKRSFSGSHNFVSVMASYLDMLHLLDTSRI